MSLDQWQRARWFAILGICLVVAHSLSSPPANAAVTAANYRKKAPRFNLKDAQGSDVKLSDYKGKVVLLNFWATWCVPCRTEIPWLIELQNTYKEREFAVLGVSMDVDGWKDVRPYLIEHSLNYRVVIGDDRLMDKYSEFDALPSTFLIDRAGRIASTHIGLASQSIYQSEVLYLLGEPTSRRTSVPSMDGSRPAAAHLTSFIRNSWNRPDSGVSSARTEVYVMKLFLGFAAILVFCFPLRAGDNKEKDPDEIGNRDVSKGIN